MTIRSLAASAVVEPTAAGDDDGMGQVRIMAMLIVGGGVLVCDGFWVSLLIL